MTANFDAQETTMNQVPGPFINNDLPTIQSKEPVKKHGFCQEVACLACIGKKQPVLAANETHSESSLCMSKAEDSQPAPVNENPPFADFDKRSHSRLKEVVRSN
jgi:hypothetical protein